MSEHEERVWASGGIPVTPELYERLEREMESEDLGLRSIVEQIAGCFDEPGLPNSKLPELVAKLAAREKLYTETVKVLAEDFEWLVEYWEKLPPKYGQMGIAPIRQLLSLAREGGAK